MLDVDREKLLDLAKDFHTVSGTLLSIYDDRHRMICAWPDSMCAFCTQVRTSRELTRRCLSYDEQAFANCDRTARIYIYHCHMGLTEVVAPIRTHHRIIGYLLFGQITERRDRSALIQTVRQTAADHGLDPDRLADALSCVRYMNTESIRSIAKMLEGCACYIWLNGIIREQDGSPALAISQFIAENLGQPLPVDTLCRRFGLSRSALYQLSRDSFGCGITDYIRSQRMSVARRLLARRELSVAQTAEAVGIPDANYFTKVFKKTVGMTPRLYRADSTDPKNNNVMEEIASDNPIPL